MEQSKFSNHPNSILMYFPFWGIVKLPCLKPFRHAIIFGGTMSPLFSVEFSNIFQSILVITSGKICKEIGEYYTVSSHRRCSIKKVVLKMLQKLARKHLCWKLFFNKVVGWRPATLLKNRLQHRCFPVNFANFLKTTFCHNSSGRLLLITIESYLKKGTVPTLLDFFVCSDNMSLCWTFVCR